MVDESEEGRGWESRFEHECQELERAARKWGQESGRHKIGQRLVKLGLGWLAVVPAAVATASAFSNEPQIAAWAALIATILAGWQTFQNPLAKEEHHQARQVQCQHLERKVRHLRLLKQGTEHNERCKELEALSAELMEILQQPGPR